jgi:hypothetical protein
MEESGLGSNEVDRLFAMVAERYGARLTPAQLEDVRKGIEAVVTGARALRAVKLENSDEPMQPFVPFRADS